MIQKTTLFCLSAIIINASLYGAERENGVFKLCVLYDSEKESGSFPMKAHPVSGYIHPCGKGCDVSVETIDCDGYRSSEEFRGVYYNDEDKYFFEPRCVASCCKKMCDEGSPEIADAIAYKIWKCDWKTKLKNYTCARDIGARNPRFITDPINRAVFWTGIKARFLRRMIREGVIPKEWFLARSSRNVVIDSDIDEYGPTNFVARRFVVQKIEGQEEE